LAATSAALAQALSSPAGNYYHPTRPYGVSGFLFFSAIAETKDESSLAVINKVRHITGVDDTTARGFLSYAKAALETLDMEAPSRNKEFCARRTEMNTL